MALPSRLRVLSHLSHERSEAEATAFLARLKARTDGCAPFFTSDQLPAYVAALIANYSTPQPSPRQRGPGRPRKAPPRVVDPHLRYAQVNKRRAGGRVVEVKRHILFGSEDDLIQILETDGCGAKINTSYIERDNLTSRHSNGRLVRKTLSHSKKKVYLQRHIDLEDAIYNCNAPKVTLCLYAVATPTSGAVDRIALGSVSGIDSASGTVDDAQQSAAFLAPGPQVEFDTRHPVPGPLLRGRGGVPTRLGVAACAG
jgi:hypothetical protein